MKLPSPISILALLGIFTLVAAGCSGSPNGNGGAGTPPPAGGEPTVAASPPPSPMARPTPTPDSAAGGLPTPGNASNPAAPTDVGPGIGNTATPGMPMLQTLAPIDAVDIRVAESFPPQYFAQVKSGLPNGCIRFDRYETVREGRTIRLTFINQAPADRNIMCTMVYGIVETNVALGSDFQPGVTYTLLVNGVTKTFVAQGAAPSGTDDEPVPAGLDREFQLAFGKHALLSPGEIEVEFVDVLEDSRCPTDVVCVWEGRARVVVRVEAGDRELGEGTLSLGAQSEEEIPEAWEGLSLKLLALTPAPTASGPPTARQDYVATLLVSAEQQAPAR